MSDPTQPGPPAFENRDPNSPGFWNERFDRQFMPWDQAGVPDAFRKFVAGWPVRAGRGPNVLIPGCGNA